MGYHDSYYAVNGESAKPEKTPGRVARKAGSYTVGGGWVARKAGSYMVGGFAKVTMRAYTLSSWSITSGNQ